MENLNKPNFICPISMGIMNDPVIAQDGHSYERDNIEQWLSQHNTSPLTNQVIGDRLIPNWNLKKEIEEYVQKSGNETFRKSTQMMQASQQSNGTSIGKNTVEYQVVPISLNGETYLMINFKQVLFEENPIDLVCAVDISTSMSWEADNNPDVEADKYSRMDLVKHALTTLVKSLPSNYRFSLVVFSSDARVETDLLEVGSNRQQILQAISTLTPNGATNLYAGLKAGLSVIGSNYTPGRNTRMLVFTDGESTAAYDPPRGILSQFERDFRDYSNNVKVSIFGFGYQLNSRLLESLSSVGNGQFGYISDASMAGTIFINYSSNLQVAGMENVYFDVVSAENRVNCSASNLQLNKDKSVLVPVEKMEDDYRIEFRTDNAEFVSSSETLSEDKKYHTYYRVKVVSLIETILNTFDSVDVSVLKNLIDQLYREMVATQLPSVLTLAKELKSTSYNEQQIGLSIEGGNYPKWGKHYLRNILYAHREEICTSFKEPGLQLYTSDVFLEKQEEVEEIFMAIPNPTPSIKGRVIQSFGGNVTTSAPRPAPRPAPSISQVAYNYSGGCFDGNGRVAMENKTKLVKELKKGDILKNGHKVRAVIRQKVSEYQMVDLNGMKITAYHPVKSNGVWTFPKDLDKVKNTRVDYIYNVVLASGHIMYINDVPVVTLGHHFTDNSVIKHKYFGTNEVIDDLKKIEGFDNGMITIKSWNLLRGDNGDVIGSDIKF